jgi:hypothetical protein
MFTDLRAKNPRSTQWCVVGITNKANRKKFAHRSALTMARGHIVGCAVSITVTAHEYSFPAYVCQLSDETMHLKPFPEVMSEMAMFSQP